MNNSGFSLVETLIAMFLTAVVALATVPMFVKAAQSNEVGADMGTVGSVAVDRMEQLLETKWRDLSPGGDLDLNLDGYSDGSNPEFDVRWRVSDNPSPSFSKTITVVAVSRSAQMGPRRRAEFTVIRGR